MGPSWNWQERPMNRIAQTMQFTCQEKISCWTNTSTFSQKVTGEPCCTLPRVSGVNRLYTWSNMGERAKLDWIAANSTQGTHTHPVRHKRPKAAALKYKTDTCLFFCYTMTSVLVLVTQLSSFISFRQTVKKSLQMSQGKKPFWNPEWMGSVVMMIALKENFNLLKRNDWYWKPQQFALSCKTVVFHEHNWKEKEEKEKEFRASTYQ
jgi:hypothetical protein